MQASQRNGRIEAWLRDKVVPVYDAMQSDPRRGRSPEEVLAAIRARHAEALKSCKKRKVTFDPEAVRAFEYAGWQQAAAQYDATFAQATAGFAEALLDAAAITAGMPVLDLCCGTGIVAATAARRGAQASGFDFSPAMLAEARRNHPQIAFDEGDVEALPYPDRSFDAVVDNFGVHHAPRPAQAVAEALRVLRPGGRFAFTTWAAPADNIAWQLLFDAIGAHGDLAAARTPPSGGNLVSLAAVLELLQAAGFAAAQAELLRREWRLAEPGDLVAALARGTVRTAALITAQPAAARLAIIAAVAPAAAPYRRVEGYAVPIAAILGYGTRPL
jgi:ubiquinone/menaquinone biosynthesis C-methylase UbiE